MSRFLMLLLSVCLVVTPAFGSIQTGDLTHKWVEYSERTYEVRRYDVDWRWRVSSDEKIHTGLSFTLPFPRQLLWNQSLKYSLIGEKTRGVKKIEVLYQDAHREIVQVTLKVLWKTATLKIEFERNEPREIRFQIDHSKFGHFRGVVEFKEVPRAGDHLQKATEGELTAVFQPAYDLPSGIVLMVQRMVLLRGLRAYFELCEDAYEGP